MTFTEYEVLLQNARLPSRAQCIAALIVAVIFNFVPAAFTLAWFSYSKRSPPPPPGDLTGTDNKERKKFVRMRDMVSWTLMVVSFVEVAAWFVVLFLALTPQVCPINTVYTCWYFGAADLALGSFAANMGLSAVIIASVFLVVYLAALAGIYWVYKAWLDDCY